VRGANAVRQRNCQHWARPVGRRRKPADSVWSGRTKQDCVAVTGETNSSAPECTWTRRLQRRAACSREFSQTTVSCLLCLAPKMTEAELSLGPLQTVALKPFADTTSDRTGISNSRIILARFIVLWTRWPLLRSIKNPPSYCWHAYSAY